MGSELVLVLAALLGQPVGEEPSSFVEAVEQAHHEEAWDAKSAVQADLVVQFGRMQIIDGTMLFDTPVGRSRIDLAGGGAMVFDGGQAYATPANVERARFHLLTWPYFLAAPFKLDDPGTSVEPLGLLPWQNGHQLPAAKLTFDDGVGDTPDDWYILYRDPQTSRLVGMAYIVTYGTPVEQAEAKPHAITYHDFQEIDGVILPLRWTFHNWTREQGVQAEAIGEATLSNVRFATPAADAFDRPPDSQVDALPQ